jgi:hypothetical protein
VLQRELAVLLESSSRLERRQQIADTGIGQRRFWFGGKDVDQFQDR